MNIALPSSKLWRRKLRARRDAELRALRILRAGGPGSGCNPDVAIPFCGRPPKDVQDVPTRPLSNGETTEDAWRDRNTGEWNRGREAFHEAVLQKMMQGHAAPVGRRPIATILGGGTASGKTTASRMIIGDDPNVLRIDPDELKLAVPEYADLKRDDPGHAALRVHEESSYMTKMMVAEAARRGLDITYDSTTSGNGGPAMAKFLSEKGYDVRVLFVDVPIQMAVQRAENRALNSSDPINRGRHVPIDVIQQSHAGAAAKFQELKDMPGITSKRFYDTTEREPRLIYERQGNGEEKIYDVGRWHQYQNKAKGLAEVSAAHRHGFRPVQVQRGR